MKKIHYNKLIRDTIPEYMDRKGVSYSIRKLSQRRFRKELLKKVGEEASALPVAKTKKEIIEELADTLDVIAEIRKQFTITPKQIRAAQKQAKNKKGGFGKQLFLQWAEDGGYRTNERRYPKKSNSSKVSGS